MKPAALIAIVIATAAVVAVPASAGASNTGDTLRYTSTNPQNTDLDLAEPGPGPGDLQVFTSDAVRNGTKVGYEAGECRLIVLTADRLLAHCHVTVALAGGTLTAQGVFQENPQQGPTGYTWAITGGTGRYRASTGELTGTFIPNTNDVHVVIRLA
jgi:hypothetical protein